MGDLIELDYLLNDIAEMIGRAEQMAGEVSGEEAGRAPAEWTERLDCPDCGGSGTYCVGCNGRGYFDVIQSDPGEPAVEGWPAMVKLAATLGSMAETLRAARAGEVAEAIVAARKESMDAPEPIQPGDEHYYNR